MLLIEEEIALGGFLSSIALPLFQRSAAIRITLVLFFLLRSYMLLSQVITSQLLLYLCWPRV